MFSSFNDMPAKITPKNYHGESHAYFLFRVEQNAFQSGKTSFQISAVSKAPGNGLNWASLGQTKLSVIDRCVYYRSTDQLDNKKFCIFRTKRTVRKREVSIMAGSWAGFPKH